MENLAGQDAQELEWIRHAQRGNREAFGMLVERFQRRVFALVFRLIGDRDQVEDLAQEIFIKAFRAMRSYSFGASFGTWLSRIAVNHCYDFLRHRRATSGRFESMGDGLETINSDAALVGARDLDPEQAALLRDLTSKLLARAPQDDRAVLVLKELEGLSVEEIAEILGVRIGTVKVRLHRARKRMLEDFRRLQQRG
jgi:RNA polymerase sigma-70 factor (ECF subfamily)